MVVYMGKKLMDGFGVKNLSHQQMVGKINLVAASGTEKCADHACCCQNSTGSFREAPLLNLIFR